MGCVETGAHLADQCVGDVVFVGVGAPAAAERASNGCVYAGAHDGEQAGNDVELVVESRRIGGICGRHFEGDVLARQEGKDGSELRK